VVLREKNAALEAQIASLRAAAGGIATELEEKLICDEDSMLGGCGEEAVCWSCSGGCGATLCYTCFGSGLVKSECEAGMRYDRNILDEHGAVLSKAVKLRCPSCSRPVLKAMIDRAMLLPANNISDDPRCAARVHDAARRRHTEKQLMTTIQAQAEAEERARADAISAHMTPRRANTTPMRRCRGRASTAALTFRRRGARRAGSNCRGARRRRLTRRV